VSHRPGSLAGALSNTQISSSLCISGGVCTSDVSCLVFIIWYVAFPPYHVALSVLDVSALSLAAMAGTI
jgi:hypothetical protein